MSLQGPTFHTFSFIHPCRYVSGDYRFRNGYCKSNPRKMVQMWAEKEMRNLARLRQVSGRELHGSLLLSPLLSIMDQHGPFCDCMPCRSTLALLVHTQAGINAPLPLQLRLHVLVMEFIGDDGVAAPRLRDAGLTPERMRR